MTTEQDQSTTEDRPNKATSSTTDRPIASGDGRSASFAVSGPDSPATDDSNDSGPYIDDIAPRRTRDFGDLTRAGLSLLMAAVVMVFAVYLGGMTRGVESDAHTAAKPIKLAGCFPLHRTDAAGHHGHRSYSCSLSCSWPANGCKLRCPRWPCLPDTALCGSYRRQSAV